jgi:hypothetical protein
MFTFLTKLKVDFMKKLAILILLAFSVSGYAQYKDSGFPKESIKDGIVNNQSSPLFGFLNSENFHMRHSFSMSYSAFGNQGLALGVYTNSMLYQFAENLDVQADISVVNSPYSTFSKEFQNSLTGIYLSRAAINYKPWNDFFITVQYRNLPYNYYPYGGYYRGGLSGWYDNPFYGF